MKLLSGFQAHRVHDQVIVQMPLVTMRGDDDLVAGKVFGKPKPDLVRSLGCEIIVGAERLNDVVVLSTVGLAEFVLNEPEFIDRGLGRAVNTRNKNAIVGLVLVHDIRKDIVHRAS